MYWTKDIDDGAAKQEERGRPQNRFMDVVRKDMKRVGATEEEARVR